MLSKRSSFFLVLTLCLVNLCDLAFPQQPRRALTLADEINLWLFIPDMDRPNPRFSPDEKYFAVYSERGRLDLNRPEYSLRFYRSAEVEKFLNGSDLSQPPLPAWDLRLATDKGGPIIHDWRWLADSSGVVFLQRIDGKWQLVLADLQKKKLQALTAKTENVESFDVRDRGHYVYTTVDPHALKKLQEEKQAERQSPEIVGTGRRLGQLILPNDPVVMEYSSPRASLWARVSGQRFQVKRNGTSIFPEGDLALSPDGSSLVTTLKVPDVPPSWEKLYPPASESSGPRIHAGHESANQYVRINLQTGSVQPLTGAPISGDAGWWAEGGPAWSKDREAILLPGTFLKSMNDAPSRPCVAVVELRSSASACVEELKAPTGTQADYHTVSGVRFADGDKRRAVISFSRPDGSTGQTEYEQQADNTWDAAHNQGTAIVGNHVFEVRVKQGVDQPPLLFASNENSSRLIWDPNPQLKKIELGHASIYRWKDKEGREFKGGLFQPPNYKPGQRYPLVIQTHGFDESYFFPSGPGMPTAFAARALAAAGIVVLQVDEDCPFVTPKEGPCAVSAYESGVDKLVSEGLADPEKIGIIGFSRSCFYVMETLTTSSLHLKAASITSGLTFDYWQYMFGTEGDAVIGTPPFGEGLQLWLKQSPGFNLDKVKAPLMVVGQGPDVLLTMWAAYAGLHQLGKPVDLIMLNSDEHVLTNPAIRMASQGGSVDWFRFWLQGYEDPAPAKAEQYKRWRELRKLQAENDKKRLVTDSK
jgi:dipeptidyl aminopeptidase/acylaminoacyl peptidase